MVTLNAWVFSLQMFPFELGGIYGKDNENKAAESLIGLLKSYPMK